MALAVPKVIEKCPLAVQDVDIANNGALNWLEKEAKNPEAFAVHILESLAANRFEFRDISVDLAKQYQAGNWWQAGYDVGSLVSEAVVGDAAPATHPVVAAAPASDMNGVLGWLESHRVEAPPKQPLVGLDDSSKVMVHPVKGASSSNVAAKQSHPLVAASDMNGVKGWMETHPANDMNGVIGWMEKHAPHQTEQPVKKVEETLI